MQETPQLEDGYTKIANEIIDALARFMPGATEGQIIYAILRKTYGWHKKEDKISITQLIEMTGKSKRMIIYALQNLEAKKIIFIKREILHGEKQSNLISFNKNYKEWVVQNLAPQVEKRRQYDKFSSARRRSSARLCKKVVQDSVKVVQNLAHTKETITKDNIQKILQGGLFPKQASIFIERFNTLFHSTYRETDKLKVSLNARLEKFTIDQILQATHNLSLSEFHQGKNDRGWKADPYFLLRNDGQIDKWLNYEPKKAFKSENLDIYDKLPVKTIKN